jgi:hypothetical protein
MCPSEKSGIAFVFCARARVKAPTPRDSKTVLALSQGFLTGGATRRTDSSDCGAKPGHPAKLLVTRRLTLASRYPAGVWGLPGGFEDFAGVGGVRLGVGGALEGELEKAGREGPLGGKG